MGILHLHGNPIGAEDIAIIELSPDRALVSCGYGGLKMVNLTTISGVNVDTVVAYRLFPSQDSNFSTYSIIL